MWFDCWVVPSGADHYEAAHTWFNYLQDPKVAASVSNEIKYILPVNAALAELGEDLRSNPSINLSPALLDRMYLMKPTTSKLSKITNKVWNAMKLNSAPAQ